MATMTADSPGPNSNATDNNNKSRQLSNPLKRKPSNKQSPSNPPSPTAPTSNGPSSSAPAASSDAAAVASAPGSSGDVGQAPTLQSTGSPSQTTASASVPPTPVDAVAREKDKGSVATSVTATGSHQRRKADASEGAHSSAATATAPRAPNENGKQRSTASTSQTKGKQSFIAKLVRVLVPCVGPSKAHGEIEPDSPKASTKAEKDAGVAASNKEKEVAQESAAAPPASEPISLDAAADKVSGEDSTAAAPVVIIPPSPPADDPAVVVPATPTKSTLPREETEGVTSGAVQPPGSTGDDAAAADRTRSQDGDESDRTSFTDEEDEGDEVHHAEVEDEEERLIIQGGAGIPVGPDGIPRPLLPPVAPQHAGRKCLVLDLDETLVHSSFKSIQQADYVVPVEIEYHWHNVYVIKRPGVDAFLKKMGEIYEIVVFTASLSKYADPVLDKLDIHRVVTHRLFRESCYNHRGNYVKDLSQLGRPIADTIILDNSPASYIFHPNNAVPVSSWFNDPHDTELTDLCPFLSDLATTDDVRGVLDGGL